MIQCLIQKRTRNSKKVIVNFLINKKEEFHTIVVKEIFISKISIPDIQTMVNGFLNRVRNPTENDWGNLYIFTEFVNWTREKNFVFCMEDIEVIKWYVNAGFGVHSEINSHSTEVMKMGDGGRAIVSISMKNNLKLLSSTEA